MRRTGDTDKNLLFDMLKMVLEDWFVAPENLLGTNFYLYDTYYCEHELAERWLWGGRGFPLYRAFV